MSLACKTFASFLLISILSAQGKLAGGSPWPPWQASLECPLQRLRGHSPAFTGGESQGLSNRLLFTGTDIVLVQGVLNQSISLDIASEQLRDVDDIRWSKDGTRIARVREGTVREQKEGYQVSLNGTLTIKHLQRSDHSSFTVTIYNKVGHQIFTRTFNLRILGKSLLPKFLHLNMGAV